MPVRIPQLQRIQTTSNQPQETRINARVRGNAQGIQQNVQSLANLGKQGIELYQEVENDKIRDLSYQAEQQYKKWSSLKLDSLKEKQGDPTNYYVQYEEEENKLVEDIVNKNPDLSERVREGFKRNVEKVRDNQRLRVISQREAQRQTYKHNLFESTVKLKKNDLPNTAAFVRPDDETSFLAFDSSLNDIKSVIAERGIELGTVDKVPEDAKDGEWNYAFEDVDGKMVKVKMSNTALLRVAKERSEGITNSIEALLASGQIEKAEALQEKYKKEIDSLSTSKLTKKFESANVDKEAYRVITEIRNLSPEQQIAKLEKMKEGEVKSKVLAIKDANDRRIENMRQRQYDKNFEEIANKVLNNRDKYFGIADLQADDDYISIESRLDVKGKKALEQMIKPPKTTDPKAEANMLNIVFGNDPNKDLRSLTPEQFMKELIGLSDSDRTKYTSLYRKLNTETAGEERTKYKQAEKFVYEAMLKDKLIKKEFGNLTPRSERELIIARQALMDHLASEVGPMTPKEMKDYANSYVEQVIKGNVDDANFQSPRPRRQQVQQPVAALPGQPAQVDPVDQLSVDEVKVYARDFYKQFKPSSFPTRNDAAFRKYIRSRMNQ